MHIDLSISRIREYRRIQGWSVLRLANAAGLNESTIRKIDDPTWSPVADTLRSLEMIIPADFQPPAAVNENAAADEGESAVQPITAPGGRQS